MFDIAGFVIIRPVRCATTFTLHSFVNVFPPDVVIFAVIVTAVSDPCARPVTFPLFPVFSTFAIFVFDDVHSICVIVSVASAGTFVHSNSNAVSPTFIVAFSLFIFIPVIGDTTVIVAVAVFPSSNVAVICAVPYFVCCYYSIFPYCCNFTIV